MLPKEDFYPKHKLSLRSPQDRTAHGFPCKNWRNNRYPKVLCVSYHTCKVNLLTAVFTIHVSKKKEFPKLDVTTIDSGVRGSELPTHKKKYSMG